MAYGKPVLTFKRSKDTLQCVEYCYIEEGGNGLIFDDINDCVAKIGELKKEELKQMGQHARDLVMRELTPRQMVENAFKAKFGVQ